MRRDVSFWCTITGLLSATSGCGLLSIPYVRSYPDAHIRKVVVHDEQTGDRILNADITCTLIEWEGWMPPHLPCRTDVPKSTHTCDSRCSKSWKAKYVEDGRYELAPETRVCVATIWLPLPPVLGPAIYKSYASQVTFTAPGYDNLIVPGEVPREELEKRQVEKRYRPFSFADDALHVYLRRSTDVARRTHDSADGHATTPEGVRYETHTEW